MTIFALRHRGKAARTHFELVGTPNFSIAPAAVPSGPLYPFGLIPKGRAMGSYWHDRSHRESQLGRIDYRKRHRPLCGGSRGPARSGTKSGEIPGREKYVTDSKTAVKPILWFHHDGTPAG